MAMENLTKQQIVLLTLLVSFMTSIATGIVTVSLINEAPAATTNTIERVIENTVADALPAENVAAVGAADPSQDSLSAATAEIARSVVTIHELGQSSAVSGLGVVVNARGTVMADKASIAGLTENAGTYANGTEYRLAVVQSQVDGDLVFLDPIVPAVQASSSAFIAASIGAFPKLGVMAASLGGTDAGTLGIGVVDQIITDASSTPTAISTTILPSKVLPGSPLFDISGDLIGIRTSSFVSNQGTLFYPMAPIRGALPR
jgi:hypothetical protein